mmetsp:Transcript_27279/g.44297  ORF Transcript_27279/g.44297 Transcript_27279/m.44297 type:complete len:579 (+) Transcript_27279:193-1929(+)
MQASNGRELEMFEFDDADDDILSTFDDFDVAELNGDELLKALSNHDGNLFDDIEMENDAGMNTPPQAHHAAAPPNNDTGINRDNNINIDNSNNNGFKETSSFTVNTFHRRASFDGEQNRPNISRRRANKKKSSRNKNTLSEEPLFGGGMRRASYADVTIDDDLSVSDVASACSAPADLMALCGLYDDPTNTPDVLDIHRMLLNPNNRKQNPLSSDPSTKGIQEMESMYSGGGMDEETVLIRQRQQQLLQEERQLQGGSGPRRRKSHDGALPLMDELRMNIMQDSGSVRPMYGDIPINVMSGTNVQIKRMKSEPMMDSFWDELNGEDANDYNSNQSTHSAPSLDHLIGFPTSGYNSASTISNSRKSALDVAVEEAQDKINHLKQLLLMSRARESGTSGSFSSDQVGEQQQSVKKSWWSSLESELGGTGLNLGGTGLNPTQSNFGLNQDLAIPSKRALKEKKPKSKPRKKPEEPAAPAQIPLPDKLDPDILKLDPTKLMEKLKASMSRTTTSMKQLQQWDRANGLPKSHSQTMVNSNKSRKQLAKEAGMALDEPRKMGADEIRQENSDAGEIIECSDLGK